MAKRSTLSWNMARTLTRAIRRTYRRWPGESGSISCRHCGSQWREENPGDEKHRKTCAVVLANRVLGRG